MSYSHLRFWVQFTEFKQRDAQDQKHPKKQLFCSTYEKGWKKKSLHIIFLKVYINFQRPRVSFKLKNTSFYLFTLSYFTFPLASWLLFVSHAPMFPPKNASGDLCALGFHAIWCCGHMYVWWLLILTPWTFAKHIANVLLIAICR